MSSGNLSTITGDHRIRDGEGTASGSMPPSLPPPPTRNLQEGLSPIGSISDFSSPRSRSTLGMIPALLMDQIMGATPQRSAPSAEQTESTEPIISLASSTTEVTICEPDNNNQTTEIVEDFQNDDDVQLARIEGIQSVLPPLLTVEQATQRPPSPPSRSDQAMAGGSTTNTGGPRGAFIVSPTHPATRKLQSLHRVLPWFH